MRAKECVAMLLAGGQGSRLGILTKNVAKPAVPFGGKYRIIDFPLSNCTNSAIDTVGVLTQYQPLELNSYIGSGQPWDLDRMDGGVFLLPPFLRGKKGEWYKGTANAIYQNIGFVDQYSPEYVLILSGDHIYKMDYWKMLQEHKQKGAGGTISVIQVPWEKAGRFGIMNTREDGSVYEFEEKPKEPKSNKASMGIYIFDWQLLKKYLKEDQKDPESSNDFGKDIIPKMLKGGEKLFSYSFEGYWKDVGTIQSLWEANMELLEDTPLLDLHNPQWRIYSRNPIAPPHYIGPEAEVNRCIVTEGSMVYGAVRHSVIFSGVFIGKGSIIEDSIIMPNARVGSNTVIRKAIIGERATVGDDCRIGIGPSIPNRNHPDIYCSDITVIGEGISIPNGSQIGKNAMVDGKMAGMSIVESGECVMKGGKIL